MLKMKDFLLVVVVGYAIYQIGWVDGWTGVNIFLLICSLLALAMSVLDFAGKLKKAREEEQRKEEGKEQDKQP
ncbi:RNA helicase [Allisonella histaminiformans]|uniref:RNA helicase n=1 Tax=Allisonella histaminiformans TaxID=209880 RepID=UPI0035205B16